MQRLATLLLLLLLPQLTAASSHMHWHPQGESGDEEEGGGGDGDEVFGDFQDMETGQKFGGGDDGACCNFVAPPMKLAMQTVVAPLNWQHTAAAPGNADASYVIP